MKILCLGSLWRGANDAGFIKAFSQLGHIIDVIDEHYYINLNNQSFIGRLAAWGIRRIAEKEYNDAVFNRINSFNPDVLFVYKGRWLTPKTLKHAKSKGIKVVNFYPDVSFTAHGSNIPNCIPLYDVVFSTKTFAKNDCIRLFNYSNVIFVPHGYDPDIHRPLTLDDADTNYICDASFIGTYSKSKNDYLTHLVESLPDLKLKIWGSRWDACTPILKKYLMHGVVTGDLYSTAIQSSTINIALLSEKVKGATAGDKITSRTFHIPANNAFMLHQASTEISSYFDIGEEVDCFGDKDDLVKKVSYYLENSKLREKVKTAGYNRCIEHHSILHRAQMIMQHLK